MTAAAKKKAPSKKKVAAPKKAKPVHLLPPKDKVELIDLGDWDQVPTNSIALDEFLGTSVGRRFLGVLAWQTVVAPRESLHPSGMMNLESHALMNSFRDGAAMALKTIVYLRKRRDIPEHTAEKGPDGLPPVEWGAEPLSGGFQ